MYQLKDSEVRTITPKTAMVKVLGVFVGDLRIGTITLDYWGKQGDLPYVFTWEVLSVKKQLVFKAASVEEASERAVECFRQFVASVLK